MVISRCALRSAKMISSKLNLKPRHNNCRRTKVRGISRKLRKIQKAAETYDIDLDDSSECYYDHDHLDGWEAVGGCSDSSRLSTMRSHATLFRRYFEHLQNTNLSYQLFISISKEDAGCDAVYIHTPNQHSKFPEVFDDVRWNVDDLQSIFSDFLPNLEIIAGEGTYNYVIYAEKVGTSLKP